MIFTWCRKQKTDFFFLQETHSKSDTETQWKNEWGGEIILSHGSPNSCGVAILLKKGVDCVIHSKILDSQGRYIILKAEIKDKMYVLINIYAPNKDTCIIKFLNTLLFTLCKYKILNSILYTNSKLYKIGYTADDKCSFCESEPETLPHFFFHCVYSQLFWKQFESYYYSLTKEFFHLTLQDVLIGIITSKCPLIICY